MTKVMVITPIEQALVARIEAAGASVRYLDGPERHALAGREVDAQAARRLEDALSVTEVIFGVGRIPENILERAPRLRWYQAMTAGVDRVPESLLKSERLTVTSARGHNAGVVAEHVLWAVLALARHANRLARSQWERRWDRVTPIELAGTTMGIVGFGAVGEQVARRAKAFDMRVIGLRRSAKTGDSHPLLDEIVGPEDLQEVLTQSDAVVVAVPLTHETRGLFGAAEFRQMRSDSVLVDVSRGGVVDCQALAAALAAGEIGGAALDVSEPEPLPADSPLWSMENVLISPHISGSSSTFNERAVDIFLDNLRRYQAGQPLLNVVDPKAGY